MQREVHPESLKNANKMQWSHKTLRSWRGELEPRRHVIKHSHTEEHHIQDLGTKVIVLLLQEHKRLC